MADAPYDLNAITEYIRKAAIARGIDPEIALKVARSEGLQPGVYQSNVVGPGGQREPSYGPFQLYDKGLGEQFRKKYGKSASDPSTVTQQVDFALDVARAGGWSPWHGWKGDPRAGMSGRPAGEVAVSGPQGAADAANPSQTAAATAAATPQPSADTPLQGASGEDIPAATLEGKQAQTSLGGLMGAMGGGSASPMAVPDMLPRGGGSAATPLSQYIQQYIATRLRGQKPPGPAGGQGLG